MRQKKLWIGILFCSLFVWSGNAFAARPADQRQVRQQQRIEQGVYTGNITRTELKELKREQHRIAKFKQKASLDHYVSSKEARKIDRMQNRANNNIYRYKHNKSKQRHITRNTHKRHNGYPVSTHHRNCSVDHYIGSSINGLIIQPGLSVSWNIPLH